ncbi:hypothetical protein [Tardiphaga robiniae]|uniref:hypothetical protein n=1 Tax=Tardiphaga robiniae TaxID=943830 RepID=UPI0015865078|nr:hypothetical protein [Tardiphaga robiniae]NUU41387.1 hypothetical protein [Tardiphaga robiniae]
MARAEARSAGGKVEEQIEMLPPSRFNKVDDAGRHHRMTEAIRRDRAGRPPGAKNKTTRQMLDFIRDTIGDPMLESARMAMHTPATLAADLKCTMLEAAQLLEKIRSDLRPYFYAKQAPVDDTGKAVPGLTVEFHGHGGARVGMDGHELPPWLRSEGDPTQHEKDQRNQRMLDVTPRVSHSDVSHDE